MKRFQARRGSGRFTRNTMENTFGLRVVVCAGCRGCNPHGCREPRPEKCGQCGAAPLVDASEAVTSGESTR